MAYADDVVLFAESEEELQERMNILGKWCKKWRLNINASKSNVVHFRPRNTTETKTDFHIGEEKIAVVQTYKYLGITLDCFGRVDCIVTQLAGVGSRALGSVIGRCKDNYDLGYNSFSRLFDACVSPVLDYASGSWNTGSPQCSTLDKVQMHAARFHCGLSKNTANLGVIGEIGWIPGVVRRDLESLRLYNQVVKMGSERLPKRLLLFDKDVGGAWSTNIKAICASIDRTQNWSDNIPVNLAFAKGRLMKMYSDVWHEETSHISKLVNYAALKTDLSPLPHVSANLPKSRRSLISRLLCGSLKLQIEVGRYSGTPREERYCELCKTGAVEDELHFLFDCVSSQDLRQDLYNKLPELLIQHRLTERLKLLISSPYVMGQFIEKLWQRRTLKLSKLKSLIKSV